MKHTPAPWKITEEIGDTPINSIIRTLDGRLISRTYGINPAEVEATTKLIAAAPELLEALIMIMESEPLPKHLSDQAEHAIQKATKP